MADIAFIAPDAAIRDKAREALTPLHPRIRIVQGLLAKGANAARELARDGVEVFISRGGTAEAIAQELPGAAVVTVPTTGFDVLRAIARAKPHGRRVAVVAFPSMTTGIGAVGDILDLEVTIYDLSDESQAEAQVLRARREGADAVVGGVITGQVAKRHAIPFQVIESGVESLIAAAAEAERLSRALDGEKAKGTFVSAVLTNVVDGILAVDREGKVTVCNPIAAGILGVREQDALGEPARLLWPELALEETLATGDGDSGQLLKVRERMVVVTKVAISVGGVPVGAVATFHDARQIQKMEAVVRRRVLASGHVATTRFGDLLGDSRAMRRAVARAMDFAATEATVLILGETGSGKELFAQSVHNHGRRAGGPFVAVNCAALPGQLLESELFGYVAGAFTGASHKGKPGLFELAHQGTIFLDEIAEMEPTTQAKLLRVLQEKKVMRLGSDQVLPVDVRVIAATNKDLAAMVARGAFRDDLYYRLNVLELAIPPLRGRCGDIPALAGHSLARAAGSGRAVPALAAEAVRALCAHAWPGNVRELDNVMARVAAARGAGQARGLVTAEEVAAAIGRAPGGPAEAKADPPWDEAGAIRQALAQAKGRQAEAARLLGVSRSTLWRKIRRLGPR